MLHFVRSKVLTQRVLALVVMLLVVLSVGTLSPVLAHPSEARAAAPVEPQAGTWSSWVLKSGDQLRLPAPPDATATADEITQLKDMVSKRNDAALQQIAYWNAGPPAYRSNEIGMNAFEEHALPLTPRDWALLNVAIYDATVAAWDSKYAYNRVRPSEVDSTLTTAIPNPASPSYPSEVAVTAGAASAVLAYIFPDDAQTYLDMAQAAANSRLMAGVEYPSDVAAGLKLGQQVAELVIEVGKADGSDAMWDGTLRTGAGVWMPAPNPVDTAAE